MYRFVVRLDAAILYTFAIFAFALLYAGGSDCAFNHTIRTKGAADGATVESAQPVVADAVGLDAAADASPSVVSVAAGPGGLPLQGRKGTPPGLLTGKGPSSAASATAATGAVSSSSSLVPALAEDDTDVAPTVVMDEAEWHGTTIDRSEHAKQTLRNLVDGLVRDTDAFATHEAYRNTRRYVDTYLESVRSGIALNRSRSPNIAEFHRPFEVRSDAAYRVPSVAWNATGLAAIRPRKYGLMLSYYHIEPPSIEAPVTFTAANLTPPEAYRGRISQHPSLRVAVEMSGHMRTFRICRESTVERLLRPNRALLFATTYPDIGDKRYGVREQLMDDPAPAEEIAHSYAPHLAVLYTLDLPAVTAVVTQTFPTLFAAKQWSWMIYQLFTMELTHNFTIAYPRMGLRRGDVAVGTDPDDRDGTRGAAKWARRDRPAAAYDVVIRIRPDLFIMTDLRVYRIQGEKLGVAMACGEYTYFETFNASTQILRAPHHPTVEWFLDKLSDHSAIGNVETMNTLMSLYSACARLTPPQQQTFMFPFGQTAERLWGQHATRNTIQLVGTYGWHIMLRNKEKYRNTTFTKGNSQRRAAMIDWVFGTTDPTRVKCPNVDRKMVKMGPKPKPPPPRPPKAKPAATKAPTADTTATGAAKKAQRVGTPTDW